MLKRGFWKDVKSVLHCRSDWPIKHYVSVFASAAYEHNLIDYPDVQDMIKATALSFFVLG